MGTASEQQAAQAPSVDDELMALSAKHQSAPLVSNGVFALLLCIFSVLGAAVFSFDMHDAEDKEEPEISANESSKEVINTDVDTQQSEVQTPALWPCSLFHVQGLLRSAIIIIAVISLAFVTSQLRVTSQNGQYPVPQEANSELMALTTKHQQRQSSNGMSALILIAFAVLGAVVFSFDMHDAQDEEEAQSVIEASKQPEVQSPALPCLAL
jgi:hypothetical protein